ncbi:MAG: hypothetical protein ACE5EC_02505 [Phycisphaerae bacterium]
MECSQSITQAIYDAIDELNESGTSQPLEKSRDTVLIGESGKLDSVGFVQLAVAVEENIERAHHKAISLWDIIGSAEQAQWTVGMLERSIAELLGEHVAAPDLN